MEALLAAETADAPPVPAEESLLPGFESLTWADLAEAKLLGDQLDDQLDRELDADCPTWCVEADADPHPRHAEGYAPGFYTDPSEHRGVRHSLLVTNGGASFGEHDPNATISVQLEHDLHRHDTPRIVLELIISNLPHKGIPRLRRSGSAPAHLHRIAQRKKKKVEA